MKDLVKGGFDLVKNERRSLKFYLLCSKDPKSVKLIFKLLFLFIFVSAAMVQAQDSTRVTQALKSAAKLKKAVDKNDNKGVADAYVGMANDYYNQGNYAKSEEFLIKAKNLYQNLNDKKNLEAVTRKLAQSQEKQNKISPAISNYSMAAQMGYSEKSRTVNSNDVARLSSPTPEMKAEAIQNNINLSKKENVQAEVAAGYSQLADVNIQQKDVSKAEENLNAAYRISKKEAPQQALEINQKLADLYVENKKFDKAIEAKKKVLKEDFVKENSQEKVNQIQELADIYIKKNDPEEAVSLLKNAYGIALNKGHTMEAQKSVKKLDSLYAISGNTDASVHLYRDFLGRLPDLVSKDRSLVDNKILADTEERVSQLEKEKELKDELIRKKNVFNYGLIGALVLLTGLIVIIFRTLKKVQIKNKKIALQSLRREMNPHLEATKDFSYETIFITAFSQYSLQALNKSASYYILKPIDIQELILAVNKVAESLEKKEELNRNKILLENLKLKPEKQQLILPTLQGFDVVKTEDIVRLQADGNFTQVYLIDGSKKMVCRFLKHFDDLLESPFVRVHRSHIINTTFVKSYHKSGTVMLADDTEIEVSGSFKDNFLKVFS